MTPRGLWFQGVGLTLVTLAFFPSIVWGGRWYLVLAFVVGFALLGLVLYAGGKP